MSRDAASKSLSNNIPGLTNILINKKGRLLHIRFELSFPKNYIEYLDDCHGFILHYHQLESRWHYGKNSEINFNFDLNGFNFIHLIRINIFEKALIQYINIYSDRGKENKNFLRRSTVHNKYEKITVDIDVYKTIYTEMFDILSFWTDRVRNSCSHHLEIDYEELYDQRSLSGIWEEGEPGVVMPVDASSKICNFLKVDNLPLASNLKR